MLNKKIDIGLRYIMIFLLTATLIVTLSYGWYITNKEVSASGITASSASSDLQISNHAVYNAIVGGENTPYPDGNEPSTDEQTIPGLLKGDKVYYSISIKSLDYKNKNIEISVKNIDGGEFFVLPAVVDKANAGDSAEVEQTEKYTTTIRDKVDLDKRIEVDYPLYKREVDSLLPLDADMKTPLSNGQYYKTTDNDGITYRHYIYEKNGMRYNTCDLYEIRLYDVFAGNKDKQERLYKDAQKTQSYREDVYRKFNRTPGTVPSIDHYDLAAFTNWTPTKDADVLTFKFEIYFTAENILGKGLDITSLSNKDFILNNVIVESKEAVV